MTEIVNADADLALRVHNRDASAEAEFFSRFRRGTMQIIVRVTGSFELAQDLSQETLMVTLNRLRSAPLDEPSKLAAFVAQTARNLAIAARRKERRRRTDSGGGLIEEHADQLAQEDHSTQIDEAAVAIRALLKELHPTRDQEILLRHYLQEQDKETLCRELGIPEATFHVVLFRARQRFLKLLEKRGIRKMDLFSVVLV
jgi:RNA polymerase sigma-70 factor (ECF subfamily)